MKEGTAWSAIVINDKFTQDLFLRICSVIPNECEGYQPTLTEDIINQSTVHIYSDLSSKELLWLINIQLVRFPPPPQIADAQITLTIQKQTSEAYKVQSHVLSLEGAIVNFMYFHLTSLGIPGPGDLCM